MAWNADEPKFGNCSSAAMRANFDYLKQGIDSITARVVTLEEEGGGGDSAGMISDIADTTQTSTTHTRTLIASTNSQSTGANSSTIASNGCSAAGAQSSTIASLNCSISTAQNSVAIASEGCTSTAGSKNSIISSLNSTANNESAVLASARVISADPYTVVGGYAEAGDPSADNITWRLESIDGWLMLKGGLKRADDSEAAIEEIFNIYNGVSANPQAASGTHSAGCVTVASSGFVAAGDFVTVLASKDSAAVATNGCSVLSCYESDCYGDYSSIIASEFSEVATGSTYGLVLASRGVLNDVNYSIAGGYGTNDPDAANVKWRIHSQSGDIRTLGKVNIGDLAPAAFQYAKLAVNGGIKLGDLAEIAAQATEAIMRYRKTATSSHLEFCMQSGNGAYVWEPLAEKTWE